jgi:hypothetical protein
MSALVNVLKLCTVTVSGYFQWLGVQTVKLSLVVVEIKL